MAQWYSNSNGQQSGPMETAELKQRAASGQLQPQDLVWREGMAQWAAASTVKGLMPETGEIPFAPTSAPVGADYQCDVCGGLFTVDNVYDNGGGTFICKRCHSQRQRSTAAAATAGAYRPINYGGGRAYSNRNQTTEASGGLIAGGYACAVVSLCLCGPVAIAGIMIGINVKRQGSETHGTAIIVLSSIFAVIWVLLAIVRLGMMGASH